MKSLAVGLGAVLGFMAFMGGLITLLAGFWGPRWLQLTAGALFALVGLGILLRCAWLAGEYFRREWRKGWAGK